MKWSFPYRILINFDYNKNEGSHVRLTRDQASLFFSGGGKEHLLQLLYYSSAAPQLKFLSVRMSVMPFPDKNEPSTEDKNMVYFVKHVLLFRSKWVSFRSRTRNAMFVHLACHLVKVLFLFVSQQKTTVVFDVALAVRPIRNNTCPVYIALLPNPVGSTAKTSLQRYMVLCMHTIFISLVRA